MEELIVLWEGIGEHVEIIAGNISLGGMYSRIVSV